MIDFSIKTKEIVLVEVIFQQNYLVTGGATRLPVLFLFSLSSEITISASHYQQDGPNSYTWVRNFQIFFSYYT